jgi:hypothetical protein
MMLLDIIETLEKYDPAAIVPLGFGEPHSYRGYYDKLAFEPVENTTVGKMLTAAKKAEGATYTGYKGGEYKMTGYTDCYLATWGDTGDEIGPILLRLMLQNCPSNDKIQP